MGEQSILSFPEWLSDIDEDIEGKIPSVVKENSISGEQAKKLIEEKVKSGFFSKKDINFSKMTFRVENSFAINVNQKRHFETRKVEHKTVPYNPDEFSKVGFEDELEDLWDNSELWEGDYLPKFKKKELEWIRGGSAEILPCTDCDSIGKVRCVKCKGNGEYYEKCYKCSGKGILEKKCPSCNGRGKINEGQITVGGGKRIGTGAGYSSREVQCINCNASGYLTERCNKCSGQGQLLITCNKCNGSGEIICSTCNGYRQLYSCDKIKTVCKPSEENFIVSYFDKVKPAWFNSDKNTTSEYFEILEELDLGEYVQPAPKEGRVLLEGYDLKLIPITRVILNNGKKGNSIYIVGKDKKIIGATSSYLDYTKIFLFVVLPFLVALTLFYFFVIR